MNENDPEVYLGDTGFDLIEAIQSGRSITKARFRDDEVGRALAALRGGRSVVLVGEAGAGKTAIVHGIARVLLEAGDAGIHEMSTVDIMAGTHFIGDWQTKISSIMAESVENGIILYITDVQHLTTVGTTVHDKSALLDAMAPRIKLGEVRVIGEMTPDEASKFTATPKAAALFDRIVVDALTDEQVAGIIEAEAEEQRTPLDAECRRELIRLTSRFGPDEVQPRPAIRLLRQVADYQLQKETIGEPGPIDVAFIEKVFSVYSGLPLFVVSRNVQIAAAEIRSQLEDRIVGQRDAIDAIIETITLFKAGLHDPGRPIGALLFVGPTGVGKTEVARALAHFFFGSDRRMLRFDLSEFKDYHSFELLVGNPHRPEQPARLLDPVRNQPFQVLLFDELEKAHLNVADMLLQVLDEGRLSPPRGKPVNFKNTIVIATSNAGAEEMSGAMGFAPARDPKPDRGVQRALETHFRPEFLNRFQHVVLFHPLTRDQVKIIAQHELRRFMEREGVVERGLMIDVSDSALEVAIDHGFNPRYGARALKREIQRRIILPIASTLMERRVTQHVVVGVTAENGRTRVRLIDTEESRAERTEREPVELPDGRKLDRGGIVDLLLTAEETIESLALDVNEDDIRSEVDTLNARRGTSEFWDDPATAMAVMREVDGLQRALDRIARLRDWHHDIATKLETTDRRREVEFAGQATLRLEKVVASARRELLIMGRDGYWDAVVEVTPIGAAGATARDFLIAAYRDWAASQKMTQAWARNPIERHEPAMITIAGRYATGYLLREAGLHRVRDGDRLSVARVRVAGWIDEHRPQKIVSQRALKSGTTDLRSRIQCDGGLVLQNGNTIAGNRDLAAELAPSWERAPGPSDTVVRRYELSPFLMKDIATGTTTGKRNATSGREFHELLCARVDIAV